MKLYTISVKLNEWKLLCLEELGRVRLCAGAAGFNALCRPSGYVGVPLLVGWCIEISVAMLRVTWCAESCGGLLVDVCCRYLVFSSYVPWCR